MTNKELIEIAKQIRKNAYVPLTKFSTGVALLAGNGKVYTGVNIEHNTNIRIGICAEQLAIYKMIEDKEFDIVKIAVVGGPEGEEDRFLTPCGICRQIIAKYDKDLKIITEDGDKIKEFSIDELIPYLNNRELEK